MVLTMQRYGANIKDQMSTVTLRALTENQNEVAKELGFEGVYGTLTDSEKLKRVADYANFQPKNGQYE